jgi:hypothetical protein
MLVLVRRSVAREDRGPALSAMRGSCDDANSLPLAIVHALPSPHVK